MFHYKKIKMHGKLVEHLYKIGFLYAMVLEIKIYEELVKQLYKINLLYVVTLRTKEKRLFVENE